MARRTTHVLVPLHILPLALWALGLMRPAHGGVSRRVEILIKGRALDRHKYMKACSAHLGPHILALE